MDIFIKGLGNISPLPASENENQAINNVSNDGYLKCIEPDYKQFINPAMARRMSRILKMGVSTAKMCLTDAKVEAPDAIITATGLGCIEDTEKFIINIIQNDEKLLPPTSFIQSTHNTIGAQIALDLKCHNYNITYVNRGSSFEAGLLDSMMLLNEKEVQNVLLGSVDEITPNYLKIINRLGLCRNNTLTLFHQNKSIQILPGEGSAFFLLTNENSSENYARIVAATTFFNPENQDEIERQISDFLKKSKIEKNELDVIVLGINGNGLLNEGYHQLMGSYFRGMNFCAFKHCCGEYFTAVSFAVWMAARMLKSGMVPEETKLNAFGNVSPRKILIYNHYHNLEHSLILLSK